MDAEARKPTCDEGQDTRVVSEPLPRRKVQRAEGKPGARRPHLTPGIRRLFFLHRFPSLGTGTGLCHRHSYLKHLGQRQAQGRRSVWRFRLRPRIPVYARTYKLGFVIHKLSVLAF